MSFTMEKPLPRRSPRYTPSLSHLSSTMLNPTTPPLTSLSSSSLSDDFPFVVPIPPSPDPFSPNMTPMGPMGLMKSIHGNRRRRNSVLIPDYNSLSSSPLSFGQNPSTQFLVDSMHGGRESSLDSNDLNLAHDKSESNGQRSTTLLSLHHLHNSASQSSTSAAHSTSTSSSPLITSPASSSFKRHRNLLQPSPSASPFLAPLPRRSPRFMHTSTPTISFPSPGLNAFMSSPPFSFALSPSLVPFSRTPLELRRSPRLAKNSRLDSSPMPSLLPPPTSPLPSSLSENSSSLSLSSLSSSYDPSNPSSAQYSILSTMHSNRKRRRGSVDKDKPESGGLTPSFSPASTSSSNGSNYSHSEYSNYPYTTSIKGSSSSNTSASSGNGSGSSCHQCKSRRSLSNLIFCKNMFANRKSQTKSNEKKSICRKKYCDSCLIKFYSEKPPPIHLRHSTTSTWTCPACRGSCCCAACRRAKHRTEESEDKAVLDINSMTPAQILAYGLVYCADALESTMGSLGLSSDDRVKNESDDKSNSADKKMKKKSQKKKKSKKSTIKEEHGEMKVPILR